MNGPRNWDPGNGLPHLSDFLSCGSRQTTGMEARLWEHLFQPNPTLWSIRGYIRVKDLSQG